MAEDLYGPIPDVAVSMDVDAFDRLVRSQGLTFVHYRAVQCPIGVVDANDVRRPHDHYGSCSNGHIYVRAGEITCAFSGNRSDRRLLDLGLWNGSAASITVPRHYDGSEEESASFLQGDRLYVRDTAALVIASQQFQAHETGVDRMRFPVVAVELLIDSRGEQYAEGIDFVVEGGRIRWTGERRPQRSSGAPHGPVCSIRYRYIPFWYVTSLLHELRLIQVTNPATGDRTVRRMPYQLLLQRENVYEGSQQNDPNATGSEPLRQAKAPATGSFGPR